jgi:hypothetical protein
MTGKQRTGKEMTDDRRIDEGGGGQGGQRVDNSEIGD